MNLNIFESDSSISTYEDYLATIRKIVKGCRKRVAAGEPALPIYVDSLLPEEWWERAIAYLEPEE